MQKGKKIIYFLILIEILDLNHIYVHLEIHLMYTLINTIQYLVKLP